MFLIVITDLYLAAKADLPAVHGFEFVDDLQKGCFACSVVADDRDMFAALDLNIDMLEQGKRAKVLG